MKKIPNKALLGVIFIFLTPTLSQLQGSEKRSLTANYDQKKQKKLKITTLPKDDQSSEKVYIPIEELLSALLQGTQNPDELEAADAQNDFPSTQEEPQEKDEPQSIFDSRHIEIFSYDQQEQQEQQENHKKYFVLSREKHGSHFERLVSDTDTIYQYNKGQEKLIPWILYGKSGYGKTATVHRIAEKQKLRLIVINLKKVTRKESFVKKVIEEVLYEEAEDDKEAEEAEEMSSKTQRVPVKTIILAKDHPPIHSYEIYTEDIKASQCYNIFFAATVHLDNLDDSEIGSLNQAYNQLLQQNKILLSQIENYSKDQLLNIIKQNLQQRGVDSSFMDTAAISGIINKYKKELDNNTLQEIINGFCLTLGFSMTQDLDLTCELTKQLEISMSKTEEILSKDAPPIGMYL